MQAPVHGVFVVIVQAVREQRVAEARVLAHGEGVLQVGARTCRPCRHEDKRQHLLVRRQLAELLHSVQIKVDAFVAVLAAAGGGYNECVVGQLYTRKGSCYFEHALASLIACCGIFAFCRHKVKLEAVRGHHVGLFVEQLLCLCGGYVAHGGEAVGVPRGGFLERVFRLHVEFGCHLVAVVVGELVVERLAVAAYAAAYACGVCGEHCGHLRHVCLKLKKTHRGGPFVEVGHNLFGIGLCGADYAFNH